MAHNNPEFKTYIAGLRAISVIGVLLFHADKHVLSGGFFGVDVFFVISGFLISNAIHQDLLAGDFSISYFYERRARRILPAFFVVAAGAAIAAWLFLLPIELVGFCKSLIASMVFAANIYFYESLNYFTPEANQIPLLHYWSLGVEEQFYIFFPVILYAINRLRPKSTVPILAALFFASFIGAGVAEKLYAPAAFYLLPFRAFELLMGGLLAISGVQNSLSRTESDLVAFLGLALIIGAMIFVSESTGATVTLGALPCLGAALILFAGEKSRIVNRILGLAPLVFVGGISYSLYLVHWPIIVFATRLAPDASHALFFWGVLLSSFVLGWLSYRLVEQPVRLHKDFWKQRVVAVGAVTTLLSFIAVSAVAIQADGFSSSLHARIKAAMPYNYDDLLRMLRKGACFIDVDNRVSDFNAEVCLPRKRPFALLWGDSTIAHLYAGLDPLLRERGLSLGQSTSSACPPLIGVDIPGRPNCRPFNDMAIAKILRRRPEFVVLGGVWSADADELAQLDATLDVLEKAAIRAVVVGPGPLYKRNAPLFIAERFSRGDSDTESAGELDDAVFARDAVLKRRIAARPGVKYVSILDAVCKNGQCPVLRAGKSMHFDLTHLTPDGSDYFARRLVDKFF